MTRARSRHGWRQSESGTQSEPWPRVPCTPRSFTRSVRGPWERPISFLSLWSFYRTTEKCFGGVLTK